LLTAALASELSVDVPVVLLTVLSTPFAGVVVPLGNVLGVPVATTDTPLVLAVPLAASFGVVAEAVKPEDGVAVPLAEIVLLGVVALAARLASLPVV
jgi:hypothetical protein